MKNLLVISAILFSFVTLADGEKFNKAVVFSGGGFYQTAVFLGIWDGMAEADYHPDLILAAGGASRAAALIHGIPDAQARRNLMVSKEFYQFLSLAHILTPKERQDQGMVGLVKGYTELLTQGSQRMKREPAGDLVPEIFNRFLMKVPQNLSLPELEKPFGENNPKIVLVAAKLLFTDQEVAKKRDGKKLFEEVFFTDGGTANRIGTLAKSFVPPVVGLDDSVVDAKVESVLGHTLAQGAHAGGADTFYQDPFKLGPDYFVSGAVDLYPLELAKLLAKEVAMTFTADYDASEQAAVFTAFGYNNNERLKKVNAMEADHWIDLSQSGKEYDKNGFNPKIKVMAGRVDSGLPPEYGKDFVDRTQALYEYGKRIGRQGIEAPKGSKTHIEALKPKEVPKNQNL